MEFMVDAQLRYVSCPVGERQRGQIRELEVVSRYANVIVCRSVRNDRYHTRSSEHGKWLTLEHIVPCFVGLGARVAREGIALQ